MIHLMFLAAFMSLRQIFLPSYYIIKLIKLKRETIVNEQDN